MIFREEVRQNISSTTMSAERTDSNNFNQVVVESAPKRPIVETVQIGKLVLVRTLRTARLGGSELKLTCGEFTLLWILARNAGRIVSRKQIIPFLRGIPYDGLDRSVDVVVARLRKKLGDRGREAQLIKSIHGVGYMMVAEPMEALM